MARDYNGSSSYHFDNTNYAGLAPPLSIAAWLYPDALTSSMYAVSLGNNGANGFFALSVAGATANDPLRATTESDGGTQANASVDTSASANVWFHGVAVFSASNQRDVYYNGSANTGTNTTNITSPSQDLLGIGNLHRSANSLWWNGKIAEVAVYTAALDADDIDMLAAGYSPLMVRPDALRAYLPNDGDRGDGTLDWVSGHTLSSSATVPPAFAHPRIIYPRRRKYFIPAAAAGGSFQAAWTRNSNVMIQGALR